MTRARGCAIAVLLVLVTASAIACLALQVHRAVWIRCRYFPDNSNQRAHNLECRLVIR